MQHLNIIQNKKTLRHSFLKKRQQLHPTTVSTNSAQICKKISTLNCFIKSKHIAFYHAINNEVNLKPLLIKAWQQHKNCYLPILHPLKNNKLYFCKITPRDILSPNVFGIMQPQFNKYQLIPPWALHLVLTPLVAFTANGDRLGMGKGYYDATFNFVGPNNPPIMLGVAHDCQKSNALPTNDSDVRLDAIMTEQQIYIVNKFKICAYQKT